METDMQQQQQQSEKGRIDDISVINDEILLRSMLDKSEDLEIRRQIRARLREIKKSQQPDSEVDGTTGSAMGKAQLCNVQRSKETRGAMTLSQPRKADHVDGRNRAEVGKLKTTSGTSVEAKSENVTLRRVEKQEKKAITTTNSSGRFVENVNLRRIDDVRTSSSTTTTTTRKSEFIENVTLRKVAADNFDRTASGGTRKQTASGNSQSGFIETVALRKVEDIKLSESSTSKSSTSQQRTAGQKITPKMAMKHFKEIEALSGVSQAKTQVNVASSSSNSIRAAMLDWCRYRVTGYQNVDIVDFSSSWSDGLAFCALVHSYCPDAFDFDSLDSINKRRNFQLAFTTAQERGGVYPLLDVDDMLEAGPNPDWKCIFTYVNSIYSGLSAKEKKYSLSDIEPAAAATAAAAGDDVGRESPEKALEDIKQQQQQDEDEEEDGEEIAAESADVQ